MTHPLRRAARAALLTLAAAAPAQAAPADVHVRIEGVRTTIFDRVVRTDGHDLKARSHATARRCDGTNNGANPAPGPTPTAAAVDALTTLGLDFDARPGNQFDDYFITDLGEPDGDDYWWGVLVNRAFTNVGGCQLQVQTGDRVLWINDAFADRPLLELDGPATAVLGVPTAFAVGSYAPTWGSGSSAPEPYGGATVLPVDPTGRTLAPGAGAPALSGADGVARVTFSAPGWQRLKARDLRTSGPSEPAVASGGLDVCVEATPGAGCPGLPPSQVAVIPGTPGPTPEPDPTPTPAPTPGNEPAGTPPGAGGPAPGVGPAPALSAPVFTTASLRSGLVGVRWSVTNPGVGVARWTLASRPATDPTAPFVTRANGTAATSARLRLPRGIRSAVRLTVTDAAGRSADAAVGTVLVPIDDRARGVRRSGRWSDRKDPRSWFGAHRAGGPGATIRFRLGAGRPVVLVRGVRKAARIEIIAGGKRQTYAIAGSRTATTREVRFSRVVGKGTVTVRVVRGTVGIDGAGIG